ncbi:ATP-binding protein [Streptomyces sp. NBC_01506]|uniref:ATP-binding protein n=1 Tax=Streptomyces sp. NBC_01506 TaxID=2903887 RepID=UPI0038649E2C
MSASDSFQWQMPVLRESQETDTDGRGLLLVDALSDKWGVRPRDVGKTVWVHLPVSPPGLGVTDPAVLSAAPFLAPVARQSGGTTAGPHGELSELPELPELPGRPSLLQRQALPQSDERA